MGSGAGSEEEVGSPSLGLLSNGASTWHRCAFEKPRDGEEMIGTYVRNSHIFFDKSLWHSLTSRCDAFVSDTLVSSIQRLFGREKQKQKMTLYQNVSLPHVGWNKSQNGFVKSWWVVWGSWDIMSWTQPSKTIPPHCAEPISPCHPKRTSPKAPYSWRPNLMNPRKAPHSWRTANLNLRQWSRHSISWAPPFKKGQWPFFEFPRKPQ